MWMHSLPRATRSSATWASSLPSSSHRMTTKTKRSKSIVAHGCCRVDLAGGTLDMWPLYLFHPGAVTVNFGVTILARCRVAARRDRKITFTSLDTRRSETFANFDALCGARKFRHPLAAHLALFFAPEGG